MKTVPLEIRWSAKASIRLRAIQAFIARDKPAAAERLVLRIAIVVESLRQHPYLGRASSQPGVRELVIGGTPYIVIYRVRRTHILINTVWHGAERK